MRGWRARDRVTARPGPLRYALRTVIGLEDLRLLPQLAAGAARALVVASGGRAHPRLDGRAEARGLRAPATIVRDRFGVPHVYASSEAGAIYGQGFVHAQDRLFQIDIQRRLASGRLAETAGERGVETDRLMRRLGFADRAARDLTTITAEDRDLLRAYAAGVNAGMRSLRALPPEYAVLRSRPDPWHPEHSLLLGRFLMFSFAPNWDTELQRLELLAAIGPARAALVDVVYPEGAPTATGEPCLGAARRLIEAYGRAIEAGAPAGGASNAWALTGEHTATGAPLLACDPHLRPTIPTLFHVAHVSGGDLDVIGAGVPGLPGVIAGHNRDIAWGLTAGMADVSDCYLTTVDPGDPGRYRTPEGWARGRVRIERIGVREGETVEERVLETRHGPVIGPAPGGERAIALRSTALDSGETVGPLLGLARARNMEEFDAALMLWPGATFNFIFASHEGGGEGRVGYRLAGAIPARERGEGLLPADGDTSDDPPPPIPGDELPGLIDPPDGVVVSANQHPGGELELGEEFTEAWRALRIADLLSADGAHTVASQQAIQNDLHSEPLCRLRDLSLAREVIADAHAARVAAAWDGQVSAESAGAALLETAYRQILRRLVRRVAGPSASLALGERMEEAAGVFAPESRFHYRLQGPLIEACERAASPWFDDEADRDRVLRAAWWSAIGELREQLGPEPDEWSWGALHRQLLAHTLESIPVVGRAFSRGPYPAGGDVNTVWQGAYAARQDGPSLTGFSPGYRQVLDLGRWDRSTFLLPTGGSGIPGHPRYDDSIEEFRAGRQRPLLYSREAVEAHAEHRLLLQPTGAAEEAER